MTSSLERRSFLLGALAGVTTGGAAGFGAGASGGPGKRLPEHAQYSYAQHGEDLVLGGIFDALAIRFPTYIDIGAYEPIKNSNTYLFYENASHGVLVEPNPALVPKLRRGRPRDVVLEIGIGASAEDEDVDYYLVKGNPEMNTFSASTRDALKATLGQDVIIGTIKRRLVNVNKVLAEHFPGRPPDLFSVDAEGYDLTILRSLDFDRFRPRVFCVETVDSGQVNRAIVELMEAKDYQVRGGTFINTIFIDSRIVRSLGKADADAGAAPPAPKP